MMPTPEQLAGIEDADARAEASSARWLRIRHLIVWLGLVLLVGGTFGAVVFGGVPGELEIVFVVAMLIAASWYIATHPELAFPLARAGVMVVARTTVRRGNWFSRDDLDAIVTVVDRHGTRHTLDESCGTRLHVGAIGVMFSRGKVAVGFDAIGNLPTAIARFTAG
jgi:hypothetical protein